jgi:cytoskeletal protein RodZ
MDFNRGGQIRLNNATTTPAAKPVSTTGASGSHSEKKIRGSKLLHWSIVALLLSGTALVIAVILFLAFGVPANRENKYINKDQYQAVFVNVNGTNGGQVYFGHITALTPQYIRMTNVFYIQNQQSGDSQASSAYNLVKLGCELHGPNDEMIINHGEVFFWENLKSDSQVTQKANEFYKQNPNGQKCDTSKASTQQSTQAPAETSNGTNATTNNSSSNASTNKQ